MSQTRRISMKLYPNHCYVILFSVTLPLVEKSQQFLLMSAKNPEKCEFSRNYQLSTPVILFSLPPKPSNQPKIWAGSSLLISENFVQSRFSYREL